MIDPTISSKGTRPVPITDPIRVVVIDPSPGPRAALCRAIDLDRHLAVVGTTGDVGRAALDAAAWSPEVVVIGLASADELCRRLLADLARAGLESNILLLGGGEGGPVAMAARLEPVVAQIRTLGFAYRAASEVLPPTVITALPAARPASGVTLH